MPTMVPVAMTMPMPMDDDDDVGSADDDPFWLKLRQGLNNWG